MKRILEEYSVKPAKLFRRLLIVFAFAYFPFLMLQIILAFAGIMPVNFNDYDVYGVKAVVILLCFFPFIVLMFAALTWVFFSLGIFLMKIALKAFK